MLTLFRYFRRKTKAHHVDAYSAQAAFFLLFSTVPLLLLLFSSAKLFSVSAETFVDAVTRLFPSFLNDWIMELLYDVFCIESVSTTSFSAITVIWSASKCVYYIIGGLNSIFEIKEHRRFFTVRILSVFYTFVFILAITFTILLMVFGSHLTQRIALWMPSLQPLMLALSSARYSISLLVLTFFFSLLYKGLPAKKYTLGEMLPGAVISAVGWVAFSSLFAFYIDHFANYSNLYGGLTSIIIFMLWLYICMLILFFGAEFNLLVQKLR